MTTELIITLILLGICVVCFAINKPRMDFVALTALLALPIFGVVDVKKAFAGFSDQSIILIALMFIVGECLERTGVSSAAGKVIMKLAGTSTTKLLVLLMLAVGIIGSIMSSTGIVALFIPVVLSICAKTKLSPSKLMMPLAIAGGVSGMMTLVATPPNMIANAVLQKFAAEHPNNPFLSGFDSLGFFSFTPIGVVILLFCIGYMYCVRGFLRGNAESDDENGVPEESKNIMDLLKRYNYDYKTSCLTVPPESPAVGRKVFELNWRNDYKTNVLCVIRKRGIQRKYIFPTAETEIQANDVLLADFSRCESQNERRDLPRKLHSDFALTTRSSDGNDHISGILQEHGMVEVFVPAGSRLAGETIASQSFSRRYGMNVISVLRGSKATTENLQNFKLAVGDTLLLSGPWSTAKSLDIFKRDIVLLSMPEESKDAIAAPGRAPLALIALVVMLGLMIAGVMANALCALAGCLLLVAFKCIDMNRVYRCINWSTLALIVGMYPFATALEDSGGITLAVNWIQNAMGTADPHLWIAAIMLLTATVGLFISNTVVAILIVPVAVSIATGLGLSPIPFAMAVAITCSASFITPVSTPVNTLVFAPGRYKFFDFVKLGAPLTLLVIAICTFLIPAIFPFGESVPAEEISVPAEISEPLNPEPVPAEKISVPAEEISVPAETVPAETLGNGDTPVADQNPSQI